MRNNGGKGSDGQSAQYCRISPPFWQLPLLALLTLPQTLLYVPVPRDSVKFSTCPPMSKGCEMCSPNWAWARQQRQNGWWEGTEAPACTQLASFSRAGVFQGESRLVSVCAVHWCKWRSALNALQECPSKEPHGEVFCKMKNPFVS